MSSRRQLALRDLGTIAAGPTTKETTMNALLDDLPADADPPDVTGEADPSLHVSRRSLLTYAMSAPVLTIAAGFGVNLATPSTAHALPLPLTPPDSVDYYDIGDSIVQTSLPTMPLVTLTVGTNGRVRLGLTRLGTG